MFGTGRPFEIVAHNIPSRYVGGDFYNFIPLKDHRSAFVLGDARSISSNTSPDKLGSRPVT